MKIRILQFILIILHVTIYQYSCAQSPGGVNGSLKTWYKADAGVQFGGVNATNGQTVDEWQNQAGSYHLTQATAAYRPIYYNTTANQLINYNPSLRFDGTNDYISNTTRLMAQDSSYSFFIVALDSATDAGYRAYFSAHSVVDYFSLYKNGILTTDNSIIPYGVLGTSSGGDRGTFGKGTSYGLSTGAYWNGTNFTRDSKVQKVQTQIIGMRSTNKLATDTLITYADGYRSAPIPFWSYINETPTSGLRSYHFANLSIGADVNVENWRGNIAEVIAYDRNISETEASKIQSYLAIKYGITLGQGNGFVNKNGNNFSYLSGMGTTIWDGVANATYASDVFAIGVDSCSGLNQKQSKSINGGFQPAVSLNNGLATTNGANTNTFTANNSYWIAGHNGLGTTYSNGYTPLSFTTTSCMYIMDRIWKVQETGTVGNVTITIPITNAAAATGTYMVINSSSTFGAGTTEILMTDDGSGNLTAQYNFTSGDYFTFVQPLTAPGGVTNNLVAWYKADDASAITLSGTTVTQWNDEIGGKNLTRYYGTSTPTYRTTSPKLLNYNPSIEFDNDVAPSQMLYNNSTYFSNTSGFHMITIGKDLETNLATLRSTAGMGNSVAGNYPGLDLQSDAVNGWNFVMDLSSPTYYYSEGIDDGHPLLYNGCTGGTNQQSQIYSVGSKNDVTSVANANNIYSYIDGYKWLTNMDAYQQSSIGNQLYVGSSFDAPWDGLVGEVIIYDSLISDADLLRINTYLAIKYGITLNQDQLNDYTASDGTVIYAASTFGAYDHDIAGVGKDICSGLLQPKSTSVNIDAVVTMQADTANIADKEFLVWANNDLSLRAGNGDIPSLADLACPSRIDRIWHVQKTGDVGAVVLDFNIKNIQFEAAYGIKLLIKNGDDNMSGASVSSIVPTIIGDTIARFTGVNFSNDDYFTIAGSIVAPGGVTNNLVAWYKANDASAITLSGTTVTQWNDEVGDRNLTRINATSTPTYRTTSPKLLNYNASVEFDNESLAQHLYNSSRYFSDTSSFNIITVGKDLETNLATLRATAGMGDIGNYPGLDLQSDAVNGWNFVMYGGAGPSFYGEAGSTPKEIGYPLLYNGFTGGTNQQPQIYSVGSGNLTATSSDNIYTYIDGYKWLTNMDARRNAQIGNQLFVGSSSDAPWDGLVGEVIIYSDSLSDADVLKINTYLAIKYGITLNQDQLNDYTASDGTVIYAASTFGAYDHDIAGVGKDICSGLLQPKSTSVNIDAVVTMQADTANITDKEFLVWANNDLSLRAGNGDIPSLADLTCPSRIDRIWHVQKTGDVGTVVLDFNIKNIQFEAAYGIKLLIKNGDDNMSGASVSSIVPTIIGDTIARFTGVNFSNDDYFTIAGSIVAPGGVTNNLVAWYKANDASAITLSGSTVTQWNDEIGGKNLTRYYGTSTPTYRTTSPKLLNYNPSIEFDNDVAPSQMLYNNSTYFSNTSGFHMITIGKDLETNLATLRSTAGMGNSAAGNYPGLDLQSDAVNGWNFVMDLSSPTYYYSEGIDDGHPLLYNGCTRGTNQQPQIYSVGSKNDVTSVANANNIYSYIDGYKWLTNMDAYQQSSIGNQLYVGSSFDAPWDGLVGEVIIYDSLISDADLLRINTYLAIKYGITLNQDQLNDYTASDGTVIYAASTYGAFDHDIAGIGQDSCSGLTQPKSISVNHDAVVTMEYTGAFDNRTQFLVWANNDEDLDGDGIMEDSPYSGELCVDSILDKDWKVQLTNYNNKIKPVNITFDRTKLFTSGTDFALLIDTTGNTDYKHAYVIPPNSVTSSVITFNNITQLRNGAVFTLATDLSALTPRLYTYGSEITTQICRVGDWIYLKDPTIEDYYLGAIRDTSGIIDLSKISSRVDVNSAFGDLGEGSPVEAVRLMRRMLEITCSSCYDNTSHPNPHFTVRMFFSPAERKAAKDGSGGFGETEYLDVLSPIGATPILENWFKVSGSVSSILPVPSYGIVAPGQIWTLAELPTGIISGVNYVDFTSIDSFSVFGYVISKAQTDGTPMPIELLSFYGESRDDENMLYWKTASELNNDKFVIEHSIDGIHFSPIGEINGHGTTSEVNNYEFIHSNPPTGINYYRLKQIDYDLEFSYSSIIFLENSTMDDSILVYPNPVGDILNVVIHSSQDDIYSVYIYNTLGQLLFSQNSEDGKQRFFTLDTKPLRESAYIVVVENKINGERRIFKVIKN